MSRLNDLVNDALAQNTHDDGTIDTNEAVLAIKPNLDAEDTNVLVNEGLIHRVKEAAKRSTRYMSANSRKASLYLPLDGLWGSYAVVLGEGYQKRTASLTKKEFDCVIAIREKGIIDDTSHLTKLRNARAYLAPIWDLNPEWTVEQCLAHLALLGQEV